MEEIRGKNEIRNEMEGVKRYEDIFKIHKLITPSLSELYLKNISTSLILRRDHTKKIAKDYADCAKQLP